jgi:hypothetical protein
MSYFNNSRKPIMIGDLAGAAERYTMPRLKLTSGPNEFRTDDPIERWLNRYRLRIEQAYRTACSSDLPEPVVFACDLLDDVGRRVARACRGDREVEAILRDAKAGRGPAIAFFAEPLERVVQRFEGVWSKQSLRFIRKPVRRGQYRVAGYSDDAFIVAIVPLPAAVPP